MKHLQKIVFIIFVLCFFFQGALLENVYAANSVEQIIREANTELGLGYDYFTMTSDGRSINTEYITNGFSVDRVPGSEDAILFVYGNPPAEDIERRYLGYTVDGKLFPDPNKPPDYDPGDGTVDTNWYTTDNMMARQDVELIRRWTDGRPSFSIPNAATVIVPENLVDLHPELERRADELGLWRYAYVIQPPTTYAWGCVIFFHDTSYGVLYTTALILPYYLQHSDVSVNLLNGSSSVSPSNNVSLEFLVESTFAHEINPYYTLKIDSVAKASGTLRIPASGSIIYPYEFIMPDHDVLVEFIVNETGDNPVEEDLDNNSVEVPITVADNIPIEGEFDLDYNVLERNIKFNLGETQARLRLPRGSWDGNATGALNVTNDTTLIYRNFSVDGSTGSNPYVLNINEASSTITRNPLIHTLLRRQDFEDNPVARIYGVTNTKTGQASAGGSVRRPYFYYCSSMFCSGHRSTTRADFNRIVNKNEITANVYNGKSVIGPPVFRNEITNVSPSFAKTMWWTSHPYTLDVVRLMYNQNENGSLTPGQYPSRNNSDGIKVDGRFKRVFTEQNKSDIAWSIIPNHSMALEYKDDREKAKNRNYNLNNSEKVVFASDITFNSINYPIRSGYYFNPSGTYTFTLTSEIYKDSPDSTPEHEKLINDFISSFRYGSNMTYIDSTQNAVRIDGSSAIKVGTTYPAQAAFVSVGSTPLFNINVSTQEKTVNSHLFDIAVKMQYTKVAAEELRHNYVSIGANAITDSRFKAILEGYSESNTLDSSTGYKYVEFVKDGQHIYKITEKTTVTFRINPSNRKVYTHAKMKGNAKTPEDYKIQVYIADVDAKSVTEYGAPVQAGVASPRGLTTVGGTLPSMPLDQINISVVGSMYDDAR